jgi:hypothetical protein
MIGGADPPGSFIFTTTGSLTETSGSGGVPAAGVIFGITVPDAGVTFGEKPAPSREAAGNPAAGVRRRGTIGEGPLPAGGAVPMRAMSPSFGGGVPMSVVLPTLLFVVVVRG